MKFLSSLITVRKKTNLKKGIERTLQLLGIDSPDDLIGFSRDTGEILARFSPDLGEESLEAKFPDIAREWDHSKNGGFCLAKSSRGLIIMLGGGMMASMCRMNGGRQSKNARARNTRARFAETK